MPSKDHSPAPARVSRRAGVRRARCWVAAALVAMPALARAEEAPTATTAPQPPAITPPRLQTVPEVDYPEGAEGDANVILLITVDKDGAVRAVDVDTGAEPFASAARRAATAWRFEPATREGQPVTAKIRFAVGFHAPEKPEPEPAPQPAPAPTLEPRAPAAPSPKPAPRPKNAPLVVDVFADKPPPSVTTMTRAEVRQLPGAFGDPFRAIESLPGVTPIVSGLPYFYVRGAPPGNVGYFLDGVRVPYLFHVAIGPSVVHPAMVERVDLYAGGYPAQFGRFSGAIVAAETTAPRDDWHGEGNIRLFDAGAMTEGGFAGGKGTVLVGGRYSYTAALVSLFAKGVKLDYRDYQTRITYDVTPNDRVSLFAFGAYDLLSQVQNGIEAVAFGSEFYRFDARYDHRLTDGGNLRVAATWGFDQTRIGEQRNAQDVLYGARLELREPLDPKVTLRGGMDVQLDKYTADKARWADPDDPGTQQFNAMFPPRVDNATGAWADVVWQPNVYVKVTPGVRVDMFRSGDSSALSVDPRVSASVAVAEKVRVLHAFGVAHQPPSFVIPAPGLQVGNLSGGLQTSLQAASGIEVDLPASTTATVTAFEDVFLNMSDTLGVASPRDAATAEKRSLGSSHGLEVYVRKRLTSRVGGFLSYTLSRSVRSVGDLSFPAAFDRTHVLNGAVAFDLGRAWRAGTRVTFYTGAPIFKSTSAGLVPPQYSDSPERDPAFYRVDFRLEKRWTFGETTWLSFVAEMLNATLHKEVVNGSTIGPIAIPSVGLEGGF